MTADTTNPAAAQGSTATRFGATDVIDHVLSRYVLGRSTDGLLVAVPTDPTAAKVAREIGALRGEISKSLHRERGIAVGRETMGAALETLKGMAEDERITRLALRAAEQPLSLHIDLADTVGRFVEVSRYGWEVREPKAEADPTAFRPWFRRTAATMPLPVPVEGGNRDELRELLDFPEDDPRWLLCWGWLVASVFETVPRPILWALGGQGSGKSTRARMLLSVVDPAAELGGPPGKNERDDSTSARARFIPSWDNLSSVSASTSDWLCRLVTGVQIDRRALYSDDDVRTTTLQRTGVATSIVLPTGLGPDALERLVLIEFDRISESRRLTSSGIREAFREAHPRILGALLSDVSGVFEHLPAVKAERPPLPRMADYAQILHALDRHAGYDTDAGHAAVYMRGVSNVLADAVASDPFTAAVVALVDGRGGSWAGTAGELMTALERWAPTDSRAPWPVTPKGTTDAVKKASETLRAAGVTVGHRKTARTVNGRRETGVKLVTITRE